MRGGGVAFAQPVFQPAVTFCAGTYGYSPCGSLAAGPDGIDAADIFLPGGLPGLDDLPEVAVADELGRVSIYSNGGASAWAADPATALAFQAAYDLIVDGKPWDLQFADVDDDGDLDIVVSIPTGVIEGGQDPGAWLDILRNQDGEFGSLPQIAIPLTLDYAYGIAVADIDGNGTMDVAVAGKFSPLGVPHAAVEIVYHASAGPATPRRIFELENIWTLGGTPPLGTATEVVALKFSGLQASGPQLDLAVSFDLHANEASRQVMGVLKNSGGVEGAGIWTNSTVLARNSWGLASDALRPGTRKDFIVTDGLGGWEGSTNDPDHHYNLLLTGTIQQGSPIVLQSVGVNTEPCNIEMGVAIGQLDNNTSRDWVIACADSAGCNVSVIQNSGNATATYMSIEQIQTDSFDVIGGGVQFVKIVDMDGDLRKDVLSSNHGCKSISVLLNITP